MHILNRWAQRRPVLFVIGLMVVYVGYIALGQAVKPSLDLWAIGAAEAVAVVAGALLINTMGWWRETGFFGPIRWRSLWVVAFPSLFIVLNFTGIAVPMSQVALIGALCLMVGFQEEAWTRGLFLRTLMPKYGPMAGAAMMAVLFGAGHMFNIIGGAPVLATVMQTLVAGSLGWVLAGVRLRTNSIWPVIIVHALIDFASFVSVGVGPAPAVTPDQAVTLGVVALVLIGYGYFLLRKVEHRSISVAH